MWQYRTCSTLDQVMACCQMAPSHYLNQCWLIINEVLGQSKEMLQISILDMSPRASELNHWGRVTHIYVSKLTIIGWDNGLSPGRCQAITWTNAGLLLIGKFGTNFSEIRIKIQNFSFTKMHLKISSVKWQPFCPGVNELTDQGLMAPQILLIIISCKQAAAWTTSDLLSIGPFGINFNNILINIATF